MPHTITATRHLTSPHLLKIRYKIFTNSFVAALGGEEMRG